VFTLSVHASEQIAIATRPDGGTAAVRGFAAPLFLGQGALGSVLFLVSLAPALAGVGVTLAHLGPVTPAPPLFKLVLCHREPNRLRLAPYPCANRSAVAGWGGCHAKGGGTDVRILSTAAIGCHGTLQSAVMHHGHCIAAPGSVDALYCQAPAPAAPLHHYRHAKT